MDGEVNPGAEGFLSIFNADGDATASDESSQDTPDDGSSEAGSSPQTDEESLSADEIVAQRFAASLEADGIEMLADEEDDAESQAESPTGEVDLDALTPEQMRALAEEAIGLRAQVSQADRQAVARKLEEATHQAIAQVQSQYQREVVDVAEKHYAGYFAQQMAKIERTAQTTDNPERYRIQQAAVLFQTVTKARLEWEAEQAAAEDWSSRMETAIATARKSVPEVRILYAADLAAKYDLPRQAIKEIAKTRSIDDFEDRARELAGLRQLLVEREKRDAQKRRVEANQKLIDNPVRTTPNGRPRGGTVPDYRGTAEEGVRVLSTFRR